MKRLTIVVIVLYVFVAAVFAEKVTPNKILSNVAMTEVLPGVYDDMQDTCYITYKPTVDMTYNDIYSSGAEAVATFTANKHLWQKKYPKKKIIAMTMIGEGYKIYGLLIQYQK